MDNNLYELCFTIRGYSKGTKGEVRLTTLTTVKETEKTFTISGSPSYMRRLLKSELMQLRGTSVFFQGINNLEEAKSILLDKLSNSYDYHTNRARAYKKGVEGVKCIK